MNININAIIDAISVMMVLVVFAFNLHNNGLGSSKQRLLHALMLCVTVVLALDIPAWIFDGASFPGARTVCMILDTAYYLAQIVYCRLWLMFVDDWITDSKVRKISTRILFSLPMLAEMLLILINIQTGWVFSISEDNIYSRGALYLVNLIPYYFYILSAVIYAAYSIFRSRQSEKHHQNISILVYMLLPIGGAVMQSVSYGVSWLWPFTAISLLMVYMNLQSQKLSEQRVAAASEAARTARLGNELADSRVKIMLSQIQPHFVYNSLSVIQALCGMNPELAAAATDDFSDYLRCNMDSLGSDQPIPFEKELQHTKRYLSLEKLRFEDALNINFDIQTTDFTLPALTLQPITENAVRYGITKREEGGNLLISTRETETDYEVIVKDNGVGFEPNSIKKDDRSHIGIINVRQRLKTMCGGTLTINSVPNVGTTATITIPKSGEEEM